MWMTATLLRERHWKTLLLMRIAATIKGDLKAWETQVTVVAPNRSPSREVMIYMPFESSRRVFFLVFGEYPTLVPV